MASGTIVASLLSVWQGELDEVRVWDLARSASDITANINLALAPQADLVGLWHLTEGSGLTLADSSGNGLDATLGPIPGATAQLLNFSLTAGQTYLLYDAASTQGITARIYNPNGLMVSGQKLSSNPSFTAEVTGVYTLALQGDIANGGPAAYNISLIPATTAKATLAVGDIASGGIGLPSQSLAYTIDVGADSQLIFDALSADPNLRWSLTGPSGPLVINRSFQASDGATGPSQPLLEAPAGVYTLTVSGVGLATGAFSFRLLDAGPLAGSVYQSSAIAPFNYGDDIVATTDVAGGTVLYSFQGNAGDTVSFNVTAGAGSGPAWELLDPYGRPVFGPVGVGSQTGLVLGATGAYLLLIEGNLGAGGAQSIEFVSSLDSQSAPAPLTGTAMTVGTPVSGSFTANGEQDYIFDASAGAHLYFDNLINDQGGISYSLTGPGGVVIPFTPFASADGTENINPPVIDLPLSGTYQIRVVSNGFTGNFSFNLLDPSQPVAVLPTDGSTLNASLSPANSTQVYAFDATAGQSVYVAASANFAYYWQSIDLRLVDPAGNVIQGPAPIGNMLLTIPVTGQYTLLVEGERDNTYYSGAIGFSLALAVVADPAPVAVTLGQTIGGQIAAGSETNRYTLTLANPADVIFSSYTSDPTAQLALIAPTARSRRGASQARSAIPPAIRR